MLRRAPGIALLAVAGALLAAASPGSADGPTARKAATDCGTYPSSSIYPTARVVVLRRVKCTVAREIAIAYDQAGKQPGKWRCALAHDDLPVLFSCGKGGKRGNIRKFPHAFLAKGVGAPG